MATLELSETRVGTRPDCYDDDPGYDYRSYWPGREYEHAAEELAVGRLLGRRRFARGVDVGGGYGRLSMVLTRYAQPWSWPSRAGTSWRWRRNTSAVSHASSCAALTLLTSNCRRHRWTWCSWSGCCTTSRFPGRCSPNSPGCSGRAGRW